jgi:hypothetical protein
MDDWACDGRTVPRTAAVWLAEDRASLQTADGTCRRGYQYAAGQSVSQV